MTLKDILAAATPGPWLIGEEQCVAETWSIVTTTGGSIVANVNDRHDRLANARLIASAPDMAAALIEAEKALSAALADRDATPVEIAFARRTLAQVREALE